MPIILPLVHRVSHVQTGRLIQSYAFLEDIVKLDQHRVVTVILDHIKLWKVNLLVLRVQRVINALQEV